MQVYDDRARRKSCNLRHDPGAEAQQIVAIGCSDFVIGCDLLNNMSCLLLSIIRWGLPKDDQHGIKFARAHRGQESTLVDPYNM